MSDLIDNLPHDTRIEADLLGALLFDRSYYKLIKNIIHVDYFTLPRHKTLFKIMDFFLFTGKPITESILLEYIKSNNLTEQVGGMEFLLTLQERLLDAQSVVATAKKLKELYVRRSMVMHVSELIAKCRATQEDFSEEAASVIKKMHNLLSSGVDNRVVSAAEAFDNFMQELMSPQGAKIIPTGFNILDNLLDGGFSPGSLVVLAGRPSTGKSSLAMDISYQAAERGFNVLVISIEMETSELIGRGISRYTNLSYGAIKKRAFLDSEQSSSLVARTRAEIFSKIPMYFRDKSMLIEDIITCVESLHMEKPIDLLVVDYLQLIGSSSRRENRNIQISDITRSLKSLAITSQFPVLLLSQLSRDLEKREDKRPMLSDLRDSGAIEQDADIVMFLYKDSVYNPQSRTPNEVELIISKNRNGRRGLVHKLEFDGKTTSFKEYEDNDTSSPVDYNDPRGNDL